MQCIPIIGAIECDVTSFRTQFDNCDEKVQYHGPDPPPHGACPMPRVVEMVKMMYFLFVIVELNSETSLSTSNITDKGRAVLDRSEINDDGEKL